MYGKLKYYEVNSSEMDCDYVSCNTRHFSGRLICSCSLKDYRQIMKEDRLKIMEEVRKESLEFWRKQMEFAQQKHLENFEIVGECSECGKDKLFGMQCINPETGKCDFK